MSTEVGPALESVAAVQFGDYVAGLAWSPSGGMLAVACADGSVHEMLPSGGASALVLEHPGGACAVGYSRNGTLASSGEDGRVAIGSRPPQLVGAGWVEILAWAPDGDKLATAVGARVQLWNAAGEMVGETGQLPATVECLAWSPDGSRLAAGGHGGVTILGRDGEPLGAPLSWQGVVLDLAWASDARRLACGMQDCSVWVWDALAGAAATMTGYSRKVRELAWSDDGRWLATGGGTVPVVWRFQSLGPLPIEATGQAALAGHTGAVTWAGFQPGGELLATAAEDGNAILWLLPSDQPVTAATAGEPISVCAWSPDGRHLALGGETGRVAVFALV